MVSIYTPIEGIILELELCTALIINPNTPIGVILIIKLVKYMIDSFSAIINELSFTLYSSLIFVIE